MLLNERFKEQGGFLFRWRGSLPFLLLPFAALAVAQAGNEVQAGFGKGAEEFCEGLSIAVALAGALLRVYTVGFVPAGTSGRNTNGQRADSLNTSGIYSVVRNPLYLGNFLVLLGFCIGTQVWWLVLGVALVFALYYERIIAAEEAYLVEKFGGAYTVWAERTPAFFPNFTLWRAPDLPFSLRTVLRREYNGLYLVLVVLCAMEVVHDVRAGEATWQSWPADWSYYGVAFAGGTVAYLIARVLKRHTRVLRVSGR
ncbi:isoprenylcysteine carboxylmethyltransferase family protein [Terrihabitans rhizophilus]|uniref:Isoprenylcysteine carboxylmethyltransferase family protein n=1 Tax=Terrihabitans rhizophilus TaxID=3092662 RepID=A0ABU4RJX4_9HYPH|nr:isoprenylcysteine carboxylmethyltransferase family protein [Terrihabitans sp. PJ23]MDX6804478.1 isoprenylcysteine carboxylmethyltransferase family protein [Terrihabitans sp. PJ23]